MATEKDSQILNYLVRMVMPMRREFGRHLDVQNFLHDIHYAKEVLDEALKSQDPRLVEYATYVAKRIHGARIADTPAPPAAAPAPSERSPSAAGPAPAPAPATASGPSEAELRERMLKKYTGGLR